MRQSEFGLLMFTAFLCYSSCCGAADFNRVPSDKANVYVFERIAPSSAKVTERILSLGFSEIGQTTGFSVACLDGPGQFGVAKGFDDENFALYQVSPGLFEFTLRWRDQYRSYQNIKYNGVKKKKLVLEGGKSYYLTWTPQKSHPLSGPLFSVISEDGARKLLKGRTCFAGSCNEIEMSSISSGVTQSASRSNVKLNENSRIKQEIIGSASTTVGVAAIPRIIREPRWDSAVGEVSLAEATLQRWTVKTDVSRGLIVFHNWVCKNNKGKSEFVCYGLDSGRNDRFWILHSAYRGQKYAPRIHSQAKLYEINGDGMIRDLQSYETQRHWGGVHFPGNEGFVDLYAPSEKGAQWHTMPADVRSFLHDVVPGKY